LGSVRFAELGSVDFLYFAELAWCFGGEFVQSGRVGLDFEGTGISPEGFFGRAPVVGFGV